MDIEERLFDLPARRETFSTVLSLESTSSTSMTAVILRCEDDFRGKVINGRRLYPSRDVVDEKR